MARVEAVSDTAHGIDAVGDWSEFLAEAAHDDVHDIASAEVARAPDSLDQFGYFQMVFFDSHEAAMTNDASVFCD